MTDHITAKLLGIGIWAIAAVLGGSGSGIAHADDGQNVIRSTERGIVNAGPSETRSADMGITLGTGGSGTATSNADLGVTLGTGGLNGQSIDSPIATVDTCAVNVNETFAGGLTDTSVLAPFQPDDGFSQGPNVNC